MHEHDLDLIASYADGTLDGDPTEVQRLVASCEECRREYEEQVRVRELLQSAPALSLSAAERTRLREGVLATLEPAPVVDLSARRTPRWAAIASVAAALVALVGLGAVLTQIGGGGDASSGGDVAIQAEDAATAETTAAAGDGEAGIAAVPEADEGAMEAETPLVVDLGEVEVSTLVAELEAQQERSITQSLSSSDFRQRQQPIPPCLEQVENEVRLVLTATVGGTPVVAFVTPDEPVVLTAAGCEPFPLP